MISRPPLVIEFGSPISTLMRNETMHWRFSDQKEDLVIIGCIWYLRSKSKGRMQRSYEFNFFHMSDDRTKCLMHKNKCNRNSSVFCKDGSACVRTLLCWVEWCVYWQGWKSQVADMRFPLRLALNKITAPARRRAECQDPWLNELTSNWGDVPGTLPLPERQRREWRKKNCVTVINLTILTHMKAWMHGVNKIRSSLWIAVLHMNDFN